MKYSFVIALLMASSTEAVSIMKKHHKKHASGEVHKELLSKKEELKALQSDYNELQDKFNKLKKEEQAVDFLTKPISQVEKEVKEDPFAEGMADNEKLGETIHMKDDNVKDVGGILRPYKLSKKKFAEGMGENEKLGEEIRMKDDNVAGVGGILRPYKYAQKHFAEGMADNEKLGETIRIKDDNVAGVGGILREHKLHQKDKKFAEGMGDDEKLGETIRMKDDNVAGVGGILRTYKYSQAAAQKGQKFAEGMTWDDKLDESIKMKDSNVPGVGGILRPYHYSQKDDTLVQFDIAADKASGSGPGLPALSGKVQGEKQWQQWAQDFVDWEDKQTDAANARLPYASTLLQTEFDLAGAGGPGLPAHPAGNAPTAKPYGWKEGQQWAQDFVDWEDKQTDAANARLPYASTLLQTDSEFDLAGPKGPGLPAIPAGNAPPPKPYGWKEGQQWAQDFVDWEDKQMTAANTRLPYASTMVQLGDDIDDEAGAARVDDILSGVADIKEEGDYVEKVEYGEQPQDVEFVHIQDDNGNELMKLEQPYGRVPLDFEFSQTAAPDDNVSKMEDFMMEEPDIPLNMRLVQTKASDDDPKKMESLMMEDPDIPLNMRFVQTDSQAVLKHTVNQYGDELIRLDFV